MTSRVDVVHNCQLFRSILLSSYSGSRHRSLERSVKYLPVVYVRYWGSVVVKALRSQSESLGIDPQWCRWGFFSEVSDGPMCPGVDSASKNEYQDTPGGKGGRCLRVTTLPLSKCRKSRKSETVTYRNFLGHLGLSRDTFTLSYVRYPKEEGFPLMGCRAAEGDLNRRFGTMCRYHLVWPLWTA
jgi:hypothetical protein